MNSFDSIVLGSGIGGLTASITLAQNRKKVLCLEAMPSLGGYINTFSQKGYTFDTGLHYIGEINEGETFRKLLNTLDLSGKIEFIELAPDGFDRYFFPNFSFEMCKGHQKYFDRLIEKFPEEEEAIRKFITVFWKIVKAANEAMELKSSLFHKLLFLAKYPYILKYSKMTYETLLNGMFKDKKIKAVLSVLTGVFGTPPNKAPAILSIIVIDYYLKGAFYPKGGSKAFKEAFVNHAKELGVNFKNKSPVKLIYKCNNQFVVKTSTGEEYIAKSVISNIDPKITLGKLVKNDLISNKIKRKATNMKPSPAFFHVFIGTQLDITSLGINNTNIHDFHSFDLNNNYTSLTANPENDEFPIFITSPTAKDPVGGHAPKGHHTIEILTWVDYSTFEKWSGLPSRKRDKEYMALKEAIGKKVIKKVEKYIPGISQNIDYIEYGTAVTSEYWVNAIEGGGYGPNHTLDQFGDNRFSSFLTGVKGLFLAGSGTLGCGVTVCCASGYLAAQKTLAFIEKLDRKNK